MSGSRGHAHPTSTSWVLTLARIATLHTCRVIMIVIVSMSMTMIVMERRPDASSTGLNWFTRALVLTRVLYILNKSLGG